MTAIILSVAAMLMAVAGLIYAGHCAIVFQRFNDGIKDWASKLDDNTNAAINRAARNILKELDERISQQNEENEIVEPLNDNNDE